MGRSWGAGLGCSTLQKYQVHLAACAANSSSWSCSVHADMCHLCHAQVARLLLYKEYWYGTADSTSSGSKRLQLLPAHSFDVPVTQVSRPQPTDMSGTWNAFVMAANPAVEENPNTLQVRRNMAVESQLLRWLAACRCCWCTALKAPFAALTGTGSSTQCGVCWDPARAVSGGWR